MSAGLIAAAVGAAGAGCVGWGIVEARLYRQQEYELAVLPPDSEPLTVLQISDTHLRPGTESLALFVESLGNTTYDIVLATGDLLGNVKSVERCARMLNSLNARLGKFFVLGSSDYFAPRFKNYLDYFTGRKRFGPRRMPTDNFTKMLTDEGWTNLTNITINLTLDGIHTQITGLDDPHLGRDKRALLVRQPDADFAWCVVHDPAPYRDAAAAGFDLVTSGHTHGGQVRLPLLGAVVTNSTLPRHLARGPSMIETTQLFVTVGLGTGKFAPFRFLCRPEAAILNLVQRTS